MSCSAELSMKKVVNGRTLSVFAVHMKNALVISFHRAHIKDLSDWVGAKAGLSLR